MRTFQSEVMATNNESMSSMFMLTFVVMDPTMVTVLLLDTMVIVMVVSAAKM
jgi:hypothetical protein